MSTAEMRERLTLLAEKIERRKKVDAMLKSLSADQCSLGRRAEELAALLEEEERDVSRLERTTPASLLYTVLGKKEGILEKEREEAAAARLNYEAALRRQQEGRERTAALVKESNSLREAEVEYAELAGELRDLLRDDPAHAEVLCALEKRIGEAAGQLKELNEAIAVGNAALAKVMDVEEKLSSAESWGTWDLLGGGLIADIAKYTKIDEAQAELACLETLLARFRTELADVNITMQAGAVGADGLLRFADYFFDGLIFDWAVLSRIRGAKEDLARMEVQLDDAVSGLCRLRARKEEEKAALERELAALLQGKGQ